MVPCRGTLEHWRYNTFRVVWTAPTPGETWVTSSLDASGAVRTHGIESLGDVTRSPTPRQ
ncbi:MAG: hypothetical protein ABI647_20040 [Gemmatimonadota bacterium]